MKRLNNCFVELNNVSLIYDLHLDRTNNLKEIIINALTKRTYVKHKKVQHHAMNHVNIKIEEGDRLGIIGLNGSGKSTTLKVISGILKPTEGTLKVNGTIQPLIEIGAGFDPEFTGRENIYLNGYMLGFSKKQIQDCENEIIEFTDLGEFIDTPIKYYSTGMAVRLAFTVATMIRPEILLIDEMLGAGDAAFIQKAKKRLDTLMSVAKIIVIVSHDLGFVQSICNRLIVMNKGVKFYDGSVEEGLKIYEKIVNGESEK